MAHQHQFRTFAESARGYVGLCPGCQIINVAFENSLFCLSFKQFDDFCALIANRSLLRPFGTSHGKQWLLSSPMPNYFLLFSDDDLAELRALLDEAAPVLAAERILATSRAT